MKPGDLLAVYGSLRKGEAADLSLRSGANYVGEDRVNGDLYSVSWFPGVKPNVPENEFAWDDRKSSVKVEVFRLEDEGLIRHLDAYEGYPQLFNRRQMQTQKGERVWVYTYNGDVKEDEKVSTGDWLDKGGK